MRVCAPALTAANGALLATRPLRSQGGDAKQSESAESADVGKAREQIAASRKRATRVASDGTREVTSVRVAADMRESQRRTEEELKRQDLRARLLAEAEYSARRNAAVAMRWADLFATELPQVLDGQIAAQRANCEKIIASKEKLIADIKTELKAKDDEYDKALKTQAKDIDTLISAMGKQFRELQGVFAAELGDIEAAFLAERSELLAANKAEMAALFDRRRAMEQLFMEKTQARAEKYQAELEQIRVDDAEEYNMLKIRLETDIQQLSQHLETMRATYQLNAEKLEYNYRVLIERDNENRSTIVTQKKKIARHRSILSSVKERYAETDKRFADENAKLTDEYRRVTEQFKELQVKYRHFEGADSRRFAEVWEMNEEEVAELVSSVLQGDRVLHEQQLGLSWRPPSAKVFESPLMEREGGGGEGATAGTDAAGNGGSNGGSGESLVASMSPEYAAISRVVCNEAGFLVDAKVRAALAGLTGTERENARADAVLRCLGVTDTSKMDKLVSIITEGSADGTSVDLDQLLPRLRAFCEAEQGATGALPESSAAARGVPRESALRATEREHWRRLANVVSERMYRIWGALEKAMLQYNALLMKRHSSLESTEHLQKQNVELRALLTQYLSNKVNEELRVPPASLM